MAFGSELVLMVGLGFVVLGPKRMHSLLGQVARVRSEIENASRGLKTQLSAELHAPRMTEAIDETTSEAARCRKHADSSAQVAQTFRKMRRRHNNHSKNQQNNTAASE